MTKTKHQVTLPSGEIATRVSETMDYTWATVVLMNRETGRWAATSWHTTRALAEKKAGTLRSRFDIVKVLEVQVIR